MKIYLAGPDVFLPNAIAIGRRKKELCAQYGFAVARHIRTPFEDELFHSSRWEQLGRSRVRNLIKTAATRIPLALPALKQLYTAALGQRLFISFIVLVPLAAGAQRAWTRWES